jgi:hypothetical protein
MISRRNFLRTGAALGVAAGFSTDWLLAPSAAAGDFPPADAEAVADPRFEEARAFEAEARDRVRAFRPVGVDAGDVVMRVGAFAEGERMAGLTPVATAMLVASAAADVRLRVRYRGTHEYLSAGMVRHTLWGDREIVGSIADGLVASEGRWGAFLGSRVGRLLASSEDDERVIVEARAVRPAGSPGRLVSWVVG